LLDGGVVEKRGVGIEGASFAEGKEPLDVVVDLFEGVVGPVLDGGESAALMVGAGSFVKIPEFGVQRRRSHPASSETCVFRASTNFKRWLASKIISDAMTGSFTVPVRWIDEFL
jgi:hypothetical protein